MFFNEVFEFVICIEECLGDDVFWQVDVFGIFEIGFEGFDFVIFHVDFEDVYFVDFRFFENRG